MVEVLVLGPIEARVRDVSVELSSRAQRILLAALAHARGRAVAIDRLASLVWEDRPPDDVPNALKSHMSRLRRVLDEDVIASRPPGYALTLAAEHLDVHRFERGMSAASTLEEIDETLALWRGRPYGELADHGHFAGDVARLTEIHAQGRLRRAELLHAAGRHDEAAADLKGLTADDPLREPAWIAQLQALQTAGRQADAIAEARRYREHMAQVGLEPSQRFVEHERSIFATSPSPVTPPAEPSTLPARTSSVLGRADEVEDVRELLDGRRIVTLVGPGGVGKTTLAVEAARGLGDSYPDGVWFARLADVGEESSFMPAIVRTVGAPTMEPLGRSLEQYLARRSALLVIDNAEHLLDAVRLLTTRLTAAAHDLRVLVTSRQPLGIPGEVVVSVEPLDLHDATQLLRDRAHDAGAPLPGGQEELAAAVCERLDRLPLAIEMAAARLRGLGLEDLAGRLDERLHLLRSGEHGRHETLGRVVAWSYDLLDPAQQDVLDRLSVFPGPFDLDAAEAVCELTDVSTNVADLVDRSLLQAEGGGGRARYRLLETVRSYASERLAASAAHRPAVERFVRHQVELVERIAEGLRGPEEVAWASQLEDQTANLESALTRALDLGDVDAAVRIAAAPYVVVYQRLRADIGAWAEAALSAAIRAGHPASVAVAAVVALNRLNRGDPEHALALLAELPDDPVARHAHEVLGELHVYRGELDAALRHLGRAEELARAVDDRFTVMNARVSQAVTLGYAGQVHDGLALVAQVRRQAAAARNPLITAWCDYSEAELLAAARPERALELLDRAVVAADAAGWRMLGGAGRLTASSLRARTTDPHAAVAGFERLIRHWDRQGDETHQWTTLRNLVDLLIRLDAHEPAAKLLGALSHASTPTFGPEEKRLHEATRSVRVRLGEQADALIQAGRRGELLAAVELSLSTLAELRVSGDGGAGRRSSDPGRRAAPDGRSG